MGIRRDEEGKRAEKREGVQAPTLRTRLVQVIVILDERATPVMVPDESVVREVGLLERWIWTPRDSHSESRKSQSSFGSTCAQLDGKPMVSRVPFA